MTTYREKMLAARSTFLWSGFDSIKVGDFFENRRHRPITH